MVSSSCSLHSSTILCGSPLTPFTATILSFTLTALEGFRWFQLAKRPWAILSTTRLIPSVRSTSTPSRGSAALFLSSTANSSGGCACWVLLRTATSGGVQASTTSSLIRLIRAGGDLSSLGLSWPAQQALLTAPIGARTPRALVAPLESAAWSKACPMPAAALR
eukprot:CAMPEP_0171108990 /NCGR_PEP_ID=MMETSP0766_2-20121228/70027_1 /TAXON_ID=439317 /ORGANISM="Gambierdiscus australes, Strain CAWD 149" /LENGTH=163 /DNA_ID=CAMNT_0011570629 /DNA_START=92 /DNA_END=583 /DNA_ORIENTATION=-